MARQQCALIEGLLGPGSPEEVLVSRFNISLKRSDFWRLRDAQLLNDKVILPFHRLYHFSLCVCTTALFAMNHLKLIYDS